MDKVIIAPVGNVLTEEDVSWLSGIIIRALADGMVELNLTSIETFPPSLIYHLCGQLVYSETVHQNMTVKTSADRLTHFRDAFAWYKQEKDNDGKKD